jgi:hypothetical protein
LLQQNDNLQKELYSYMNRLSELQIHKENNEIELNRRITLDNDRINSYLVSISERDNQISELKNKLNEMKEDYQNVLQAELNNFKYLNKQNDEVILREYDGRIQQLQEEISMLRDELQTTLEKYNSLVEKSEINEITKSLVDSKNEEIDGLYQNIKDLKNQYEENIQNVKLEINQLKENEIKDLISYRDLIETRLKDTEFLNQDLSNKLNLRVFIK